MGWPAGRDWTISIDLAKLFAAPAGPAIKPTNIAAAAAMARQAPRVLGTRSSGKVSDGLIRTAVLRCGRERKNIPENHHYAPESSSQHARARTAPTLVSTAVS